MRTFRPAAAHSRPVRSSSVEIEIGGQPIRTSCRAIWSSDRNNVETSQLPVSEAPRMHWTIVYPGFGCSGKQPMSCVGPANNPVRFSYRGRRCSQAVNSRARDAKVCVPPLLRAPGVALPQVADADYLVKPTDRRRWMTLRWVPGSRRVSDSDGAGGTNGPSRRPTPSRR